MRQNSKPSKVEPVGLDAVIAARDFKRGRAPRFVGASVQTPAMIPAPPPGTEAATLATLNPMGRAIYQHEKAVEEEFPLHQRADYQSATHFNQILDVIPDFRNALTKQPLPEEGYTHLGPVKSYFRSKAAAGKLGNLKDEEQAEAYARMHTAKGVFDIDHIYEGGTLRVPTLQPGLEWHVEASGQRIDPEFEMEQPPVMIYLADQASGRRLAATKIMRSQFETAADGEAAFYAVSHAFRPEQGAIDAAAEAARKKQEMEPKPIPMPVESENEYDDM